MYTVQLMQKTSKFENTNFHSSLYVIYWYVCTDAIVSTKTRKLKRESIIPVLTKITEKFYAINLNENRNIEGTL